MLVVYDSHRYNGQLMTILVDAMEPHVHTFYTSDVATVTWALATLQHRSPSFVAKILEKGAAL